MCTHGFSCFYYGELFAHAQPVFTMGIGGIFGLESSYRYGKAYPSSVTTRGSVLLRDLLDSVHEVIFNSRWRL